MKDIIKKEVTFNSDIQKVWNAITKQEEISKWFLNADFKAENGYKYTFNSTGEGCKPIIGEVKSANPYVLIYTWVEEGIDVETIVKWELETVENGTRLILEHSGILNYSESNAIKMFESFNGGWNNCIHSLTSFLKA